MSNPQGIRLEVILSRELQKRGRNRASAASWHVDPTRPWNDDVNFGRLCHMLEITTACELCHYSEGKPEKVIDLTRTPEQDCYRKGMQVYLQQKAMAKTPEQRIAAVFGMSLSEEEQRLLRRLRQNCVPNLGPDDPCPLCTRTLAPIDVNEFGSEGGLRASPSKSALLSGSSSPRFQSMADLNRSRSFAAGSDGSPGLNSSSNVFGQNTTVLKPEVGVQCGQASRMGEEDVSVRFGTASRFSEHTTSVFNGPPIDFPGRANTAGPNFDFSPTILDLKTQSEQYQRERDQLALELREMTKQKVSLERWKQEHRCEVSAEVAKTRKEMEAMQVHLRELMRGREEVFAMLQARRMEGSLHAGDTPRPYAPFAVSLPSLDSPPPDPHKLLARDTRSLRAGSTPGDTFELPKRDAASPNERSPSVEVVKRPSGRPSTSVASALGVRSNDEAEDLLAKQVIGECMLRVESSTGEPFSVKRKVGSLMRNGRHLFTLSSLDGVITDEIHVEELETVSLQGLTGMYLATALHSWQIHLNPAERQRWLHWMYALNPYLSATAHMSSGGVPNSY